MKQPKTVRELIAATLKKKISSLTISDIQKGLDMKLRCNTNFDRPLTKKQTRTTYAENASNGEVIVWLED